MKLFYYVLALVIFAAGIMLVSCGQQATAEMTASPQITTTTSPEAGRYEGLGLTEDQIRGLEERGTANIESRETASAIAGFNVAVPEFVPQGFLPGKFSISISGAGLPADMAPKFNNTQVQQSYTWQEDRSVLFTLIQGTHPFGIGGGETADINGLKVEKTLNYEGPEDGQQYERLSYGWEENGLYFALTGILANGLDETAMERILLSVSAE